MSLDQLAAVPGGLATFYAIVTTGLTLLSAVLTRNAFVGVMVITTLCVGASIMGMIPIWSMMLCLAVGFLCAVAMNNLKPRRN